MPLLVTAEDISSSIIKTGAAASGVDAIFANCPALDADTKAGWTAWYTGWQSWAAANNDLGYFTLGLPAIGNQAVAYEADIASWQQIANRVCGSQVPVLTLQTDIADQNAGVSASSLSAIKWIAGAVIVALVIPPIVQALSTRRAAIRAKPEIRRR